MTTDADYDALLKHNQENAAELAAVKAENASLHQMHSDVVSSMLATERNLMAENERLREALGQLAIHSDDRTSQEIARRALSGEGE